MLEELSEGQSLQELGLTNRQAKVYLALLKQETSIARVLATSSNMARQDIYQVLDELQTLGLVEKQLSVPTEFAAIPFRDALSLLLKRKVTQTSDLVARTKILIKSSGKKEKLRTVEDKKYKTFFVPEGEPFVLKMCKSIQVTKKSVDFFAPGEIFPQFVFHMIEEIERAMCRGVKVRCLLDRLDGESSLPAIPSNLLESPSFEVRAAQNHPGTLFCIYDGKEMSISLSPLTSFVNSPRLWSNSENVVKNFQCYFDMMWLGAT